MNRCVIEALLALIFVGFLVLPAASADDFAAIDALCARGEEILARNALQALLARLEAEDTAETALSGARRLLAIRRRQLTIDQTLRRLLLLECRIGGEEERAARWWMDLAPQLARLESPSRASFLADELLPALPVFWLQSDAFAAFRDSALAAGLHAEELRPLLAARLRECDDSATRAWLGEHDSPAGQAGILLAAGDGERALAALGSGSGHVTLRAAIYRSLGRLDELRRALPDWCHGLAAATALDLLTDVLDPVDTGEVNLRLARMILDRDPRQATARQLLARDHAGRGEAVALTWLPAAGPGREEIMKILAASGQIPPDTLRELFRPDRPAELRWRDAIALLQGRDAAGRPWAELEELPQILQPLVETLPEDFFRQCWQDAWHGRRNPELVLLLPRRLELLRGASPYEEIRRVAAVTGWIPCLERLLNCDSSRDLLLRNLPFSSLEEFPDSAWDLLASQSAVPSPTSLHLQVLLALRAGKTDEALLVLEREIEARPSGWFLGEKLLELYRRLAQRERGASFFRRIGESSPWPARFFSAQLAADRGDETAFRADLAALAALSGSADHRRSIAEQVYASFSSRLEPDERRQWLKLCLADGEERGRNWQGHLLLWLNDRLRADDLAAIEEKLNRLQEMEAGRYDRLVLLMGPAPRPSSARWLDARLAELGKHGGGRLRQSIRRRLELLDFPADASLDPAARQALLRGKARQLLAEAGSSADAARELALFFYPRDRTLALEFAQRVVSSSKAVDSELLGLDADFTRELYAGTSDWPRVLGAWCRQLRQERRFEELRDGLRAGCEALGMMTTARLLLIYDDGSSASVCLLEEVEALAPRLNARDKAEIIARLVRAGRAPGLLARIPLSADEAWQGRASLKSVWNELLRTEPLAARELLRSFRARLNAAERDELAAQLGREWQRIFLDP